MFIRGEADLEAYAKRFDRYYKSRKIGLSFDQIPADLIAESPHLAKVAFDAGVRDAKETTGDSFTALVQKGYTGKITEANGLPEEPLSYHESKTVLYDTKRSKSSLEGAGKVVEDLQIIDGKVLGKISIDDFKAIRTKSIHNADKPSMNLVLV